VAPDTHQAIEAIWRIEQAKIIASLARITRDVGVAEELAQDALVTALKRWPEQGIPDNPAAWLMTTAKNRALDERRRAKLIERKHEEIGREMDESDTPDIDAALDDDIGDDLLRLIFTSCHPVLSTEARVALTLRLIGGLTTEEFVNCDVRAGLYAACRAAIEKSNVCGLSRWTAMSRLRSSASFTASSSDKRTTGPDACAACGEGAPTALPAPMRSAAARISS